MTLQSEPFPWLVLFCFFLQRCHCCVGFFFQFSFVSRESIMILLVLLIPRESGLETVLPSLSCQYQYKKKERKKKTSRQCNAGKLTFFLYPNTDAHNDKAGNDCNHSTNNTTSNSCNLTASHCTSAIAATAVLGICANQTIREIWTLKCLTLLQTVTSSRVSLCFEERKTLEAG